MYFDGTDPCWIPDAPFGTDRQWRLKIAQFGDGYQQRILDGINPLDMTFHVSFYREQHVVLAIDAYLASLQGAGFPFQDPTRGASYTVFCDQWQISWDVKRRRDPVTWISQWFGTLSATFTKGNGILVGPVM